MAGGDSEIGGGGESGGMGLSFPSTLGSGLGGAVSDLFSGFAQKYKRQGLRMEETGHVEAAGYARDNKRFVEQATNLKVQQQNRSFLQTVGGMQANAASNGLKQSGSAIDILIDAATQHALTTNVLVQQGEISELAYEQQAKSYDRMAEGARVAQKASRTAETGSYISAGLRGATAIASMFTGGA